MPRLAGTVRFFYRNMRYGFISGDDGKEYFFPPAAVHLLPRMGDGLRVAFDVASIDPPQAANVEVLEKNSETTPADTSKPVVFSSPRPLLPAAVSQPFLHGRNALQTLPVGKHEKPTPRATPTTMSFPTVSALPIVLLPERLTGWVRFFYRLKRFGFVRTAEGLDYFFHEKDTVDMPVCEEGMVVEFDAATPPRKNLVAVAVTPKIDPQTGAPIFRTPPTAEPKKNGHTKQQTNGSAISGTTKLGYVRFYFEKKDYGFILSSDGQDCFFVRAAVEDGRVEGLQGSVVMFEPTVCRKGLQAAKIQRVAVDLDLVPPGPPRRPPAVPGMERADSSVSSLGYPGTAPCPSTCLLPE